MQPQPPKGVERVGHLMEQVGERGCYQFAISVLACFLVFQLGLLFLGIPYIFAVAPYSQCPAPNQDIALCTKFVCSLPPSLRMKFENPQIAQLKTLGNSFGDFHCSRSYILSILMGSPWLGALIGNILIPMIADNFGRRFAILLSLTEAILGYGIILLAKDLLTAIIGTFLVGCGLQGIFPVVFCILQEILDNERRQKMQVLILSFSCMGGLFLYGMFYLLKDWRPIILCSAFIPLIISFIFTFYFLKETPLFLIKLKTVEEIRKDLFFIAYYNGKGDEFEDNALLNKDNLLELKMQYQNELENEGKQVMSYADLFRYPSLRSITILSALLFFFSSFIYFAPIMLVNQFGFNFFINGVVLEVSELITYFFSVVAITKIKRKSLFRTTLATTFISSFVLIFIMPNKVCISNCSSIQLVFQLIFFIIMRFSGALLFQVVNVYVNQLFPVQIAALGFGFGCIIVCLPGIFIPTVFSFFNSINIPVMTLFCVISLLMAVVVMNLKQTYGQHPPEMIEEFEHRKTAEKS